MKCLSTSNSLHLKILYQTATERNVLSYLKIQIKRFSLIFIPVTPSQWQGWGEWSHCSLSCGNGARIRARACIGGHGSCSGEWTETKDCLLDKCPVVIGKWQEWGPWAQCSATCGKGARIRARPCSKNDGSCPGEPTETKDCLVAECPGSPFCSITCFDFTLFQGQLLLQVLQHYHL